MGREIDYLSLSSAFTMRRAEDADDHDALMRGRREIRIYRRLLAR